MRCFCLVLLLVGLFVGQPALAQPQWLTLPPTPTLPEATRSGLAPVNGIQIWYAVFGRAKSAADDPVMGEPVILLHGGLANSHYWGEQVRALQDAFQVIVMDSRGHGRSTRDAKPYGYGLMASDVLALMDFLKVPKATIVGWSDGAIIGLDLAMHHPDRVSRLFAFAANSDPGGVADIAHSSVFNAYITRAQQEYRALSPTPDGYASFLAQIEKMWASQPRWTARDLAGIHVPTWIVDGDHDEAIKRTNTEFMAARIPGAGLLIQPEVSHFSFLQDPAQFNADLLHFLRHVKGS
ncbi:MAG TPA: alpha/beta fold hydrolase [Rhodopila sp.]|nr:alpha/beta fold hydrolase [Rhodopila sp.]